MLNLRLLYKWPPPIVICFTISLYVTVFTVCDNSIVVRIRRHTRSNTVHVQ